MKKSLCSTGCLITILLLASCSSPQIAETNSIKNSEQSGSQNVRNFAYSRDIFLRASDAAIDKYVDSIKNIGSKKISSETAKKKLEGFKAWADIADNRSSDQSIDFANDAIYGHLFTFTELKDYLDGIQQINDTITDEERKIDGIRVYQGAVFYQDGFIPEVFLFPTIDGKNIVDIDVDYPSFAKKFNSQEEMIEYFKQMKFIDGDGPGFNTSVPCPDQCPSNP